MKKIRRILLGSILSAFIIGGFAVSTISNAAVNDPIYLKAVHLRKEGWGYSLGEDGDGNPINNIEKIKQYVAAQSQGDANAPEEVSGNPLFYCIKAGIGFGAGENKASIEESKSTTTYIEQGDFTNATVLANLNATYENYLTSANYYKLIWLLDNLYTGIGENSETKKASFLTSVGGLTPIKIYSSKSSERADLNVPNMGENGIETENQYSWSDIINDDDIDVIQQLAVWHFTNPGEDLYDKYQPDKSDDPIMITWMKLINSSEDTEIIEEVSRSYNPNGGEITEEQHRLNQIKNLRYKFMRNLYANLINGAETNGTESYYNNRKAEETSIPLDDQTTDDGESTATKSNGYYVAGPYGLPAAYKGKNYTLSGINFTDDQGNNINDKIAILVGDLELSRIGDPNYLREHIKTINELTVEDIENGNIYFAILAQDVNTINNVHIELNLASTINDITYYSAGSDTQPVVKIEPETVTLKFVGEFIIPKDFDLALRKYITKVTRNGEEIAIPNARELNNIDTSKLNTTGTDGKEITTAEYKHRKDPVVVEKNDIVTYTFRVYNEGNKPGIVTSIKDYLPIGTEIDTTNLIEQESGDANVLKWFTQEEEGETDSSWYKLRYEYNFNKTTRLLTITGHISGGSKNAIAMHAEECICYLSALSANHENQAAQLTDTTGAVGWINGLNYGEVSVDLKVTADPDSSNAKILTNAATMEYNCVPRNVKDRDSNRSGTDNFEKPSDENMTSNPGYTGKEQKTLEELKANDYFEGIEDDDDFEKIIILPKTFDLALRKFITQVTKVDGTVEKREGTSTREPSITQTELEKLTSVSASLDDGKTAIKTHTKDPVVVDTGDIVRYTIRVYNEGQVDGKADEIADYLPAGLELVPQAQSETNRKYGWKVDANNNKKITTDYLSKATTEYADPTLKAFSGTKENGKYAIDYKDVQVECKVVKTVSNSDQSLKNVAEITASSNDLNLPDRDSTTNNVKHNDNNDNYTPENPRNGKGEQDDDDYEELVLKGRYFDLALRKFITQITKTDGTVDKKEGTTTRVPTITQADLEKLAAGTTNLDDGKTTVKTHTKYPLEVETGDIVRYTIRVYNEGQVDGKADEITDYLPTGLELVPQAQSEINRKYGWKVDANNNKKITTDYLSKATTEYADPTLKAFSSTKVNGEYVIDYKDVQVECKVVKQAAQSDQSLKNVAEITASSNDSNLPDRDSTPNNVHHNDQNDNYNPTNPTTGRGEQDDDDYEELVLKGKYFDLALRKFIISINSKELKVSDEENAKYSREPIITTEEISKLASGEASLDDGKTAKKTHSKDILSVKEGDRVVYIIRIYNEGQIDGTADLVTDYLPEGLEFIEPGTDEEQSSINKKYGWVADTNNDKIISTEYLKNKTIEKLDYTSGDGVDSLHYEDLQIECKVITSDKKVSLKNIAEIADSSNDYDLPDRDSTPENVNHDDTYNPEDAPNGKGEEDDDDYEDLKLSEFDLALRKFITAINDTEITTRLPEVDTSKLKDGTSTTADYKHPKEPILVTNSSIVTYTIRVYNEGEIDGYAAEIKDDMPEGLEFLPDNEINKLYRWVMLDKDGKETTKINEAVSIATDYLSKEQGEERTKSTTTTNTGEQVDVGSLIPAYDAENDILSYKEVKIAFKVIEPNTSDRILINEAQISKNEDENGEDVTDRDSTPDEWKDEDDEDIEKVKVQYFDLSLRKWVTQAIVNDNGTETVTETGHKAEDDPESIVKVEIKDKKLDSVVIKFRYKIRVTNEGTIAGYATEIKDYIPSGLKFVADDNPLWKQLDEKTIVTDQAKNILLQPGESTEVEVLLTWINGEENLALQMNYAEISKDFNEFDAPDIDSTPDNKKEGEDDIDDAPVLLSIKTGEARIYFAITGGVLLVIIAGVTFIKKYII